MPASGLTGVGLDQVPNPPAGRSPLHDPSVHCLLRVRRWQKQGRIQFIRRGPGL